MSNSRGPLPRDGSLLRPLVLTGGPAVGKTVTGRWLAERRPRAAYLDVDDLRQLVVAGAEAPWRGEEGAAQHLLGAANASALARNFRAAGFDVVIADILTPVTAAAYRTELPECLLVRLVVDFAEAQRRAATRKVWLTPDEFAALHGQDTTDPPAVDVTLDVTSLRLSQQRLALEQLWAHPDQPRTAGYGLEEELSP